MPHHEPIAAASPSADSDRAFRRDLDSDPLRWDDDENAGSIRRALVACAIEVGHAPAPDEYQRWRRRASVGPRGTHRCR